MLSDISIRSAVWPQIARVSNQPAQQYEHFALVESGAPIILKASDTETGFAPLMDLHRAVVTSRVGGVQLTRRHGTRNNVHRNISTISTLRGYFTQVRYMPW